MRAAIVGFGTAGEARLRAYAAVPGAAVTAVVDPSPARRDRAVALAPSVRAYPSLEAMRAAGGPDLVDVCSPPVYHRDLTLTALAAGWHVICEKPVAFDEADAALMVDASRRHGRLLYPAHNYAFSPMMRVLGEFAAGAEGTPMTAVFEIQRDRHARGVDAFAPDWRRDRMQAGGGILLDHGTHCVYMATRLFGCAPASVSCVADWAGDDPVAGIDEAVDVALTFPNGRCVIRLSWTSDVRHNSYVLHASHGSVVVSGDRAEVRDESGLRIVELSSPTRNSTHEEWFAGMFADFSGILSQPTEWDVPLDEVQVTASILHAAYASARAGGLAHEVASARAAVGK